MSAVRTSICSLAVLLSLAHAAGAQCTRESAGPFAGVPIMTVLHNEPGYDAGQMYLKPTGIEGKAPGAWPATTLPPTRPNFDMNKVFTAGPNCVTTQPLVVNALSMGDDWVLANCDGVLTVPGGRWASLIVSVTRATRGKPGSAIDTEVRNGSAQGDIFSYVLPGSALPTELVSLTHRAQETEEMGVGLSGDIAALDLFIPYYLLDDRVGNSFFDPDPGMMPRTPAVYFTLTPASAAAAPPSWYTVGGAPDPSGATILVSTWSQTGGWTCPTPWMTYRSLGLAKNEAIDGLGVDLDNERMLFSTDISIVRRNPLLYFTWDPACNPPGTPPMAVVYTEQTGDPVSEGIGLIGSDDVDAICAMDPSVEDRRRRFGIRPNNAYYAHGTPTKPVLGFPDPTLTATAFRNYEPSSGKLTFRSFLVGWPLARPNAGFGVLLLTPNGSLSPALVLSAPRRNPLSGFCGDPTEGEVEVPPSSSLLGTSFMFRWLAVDQVGNLGEAYPVFVTI